MQADHDGSDHHQRTIAKLERENATLKIQLLTIARQLAHVTSMLNRGHLKGQRLGDDQ